MRKLYFLSVALFTCLCVSSQVVNIPDANFKAKLLEASPSNQIAKNLSGDYFKIDVNNDSEIQVTEAMQVIYLDVQHDFSFPNDIFITSLEGILSFVNLQDLNCTNNQLTSLNVSGLTGLITLDCSANQLATMNLNGLTNLQRLICAGTGNQFGSLDLTGLTNLKVVICAFNGLSGLNLNGLTNLETLNCGFNNFTTLDVSSLTNLQALHCSGAGLLISLDVSGLANLQELNCSNNFNLQELYISGNQLTTLTLTDLPNIITLECTDNPLTILDVSGLTNLQNLNCSGNQLQTLSVNNLTNLQNLNCSDNQLVSLFIKNGVNEASLNMADNSDLQYVCADAAQIASVQSLITSYGYTNCLVDSACSSSTSGIVVISDASFKAKLLESNPDNQIAKNMGGLFFKIDENDDSEIQETEAAQVSYLNVSNANISSLEGISSFTNLLDLNCKMNQLTVLDINSLTNLNELRCSDNQLTTFDISELTNLLELHCSNNQLTTLDVSTLTNLQILHCDYNNLSTLNVNSSFNLQELHCSGNQLITLFIKNGSAEDLEIDNNPNLEYICADEFQLSNVQLEIDANSYANCTINTYCTFYPGGATFYTIAGNNRLDLNGNGCDATDLPFLHSKFTISNGSSTETLIANASGLYSYNMLEGTYTITPILENPSYLSVTPSEVTVTFPGQESFITQDFCYTANGIHPDLEVSIDPVTAAVPGFDSKYKIIYKNKGNTLQSGTVTLTFNDALSDFVVSNPMTTNQLTNILSWDFNDLLPFETRVIEVTLNVNSPMEIPAVNNGDVLSYTATIISLAIDETPNDNSFVFNQTVVNSFDPNDKTCLEGTTITPEKVGDYVHYMIRFENNGTANAQNIVVKDMINLAMFDINALVPIKGSHSFVTNITSGNKVEFIFENINLPFDDTNNDGYVAFKIKTKPTLVLGNTFSNTASIYFDYNFPIVTNTATTTIAVLATQDFVFSNYFSVYPNPVKDILNITAKETIEVTSVNIYNTLGQLLLVIPNAQNTSSVDISDLTSGNYFIKINSDKGTSNTKFIKN